MAKSTPSANSDNNLSKIEHELSETNPDVFKNLPQDKKRAVLIAVQRTLTKIYSGPLPDPETLSEYNKVMPNAAERIFSEFEEQGKHRRELEKHAIKSQFSQSNRGQNFAFIICISFLLVSGACIYLDHDWAGGALGLGSLTGLVTVFIKGKEYQKQNLSSKKP